MLLLIIWEINCPQAGMLFMNPIVDTGPILSIITKIELLGYPLSDEHHKVISNFVADSLVLPLSNDVAEECIRIRKVQKIKLPDALIAASALVHNLVIITRNTSDFKSIMFTKY